MLHINGHVRGLYQKIADAGLPVFHHQLAAVVVIFGAAIAHLSQQAVDLVPQSSLGQRHIQHGRFRLFRRREGLQPVQVVEVQGEAQRGNARGELPGQQVIAAALEHRRGQAGQAALKHQPIVIFHVARQGQVQPQLLRRAVQAPVQCLQFLQRIRHGLTADQAPRPVQRLGKGAGQVQQGAQTVPFQAKPCALPPQLMGVFPADQLQQSRAALLTHIQSVQQAGEKAHVGQLQLEIPPAQAQSVQRQPQQVPHILRRHLSHAFQAHLVDLHEGVALPAGTVDLFIIVNLFAGTGGGLQVFGDGQGHVRFQRQQAAVQIGEGQHLFRRKKAAVALVQAIFLKAAHVVFAVSRPLGQGTKLKGGALGPLENAQIKIHRGSSFCNITV